MNAVLLGTATGYADGVSRKPKEAKTEMGKWVRAVRTMNGLSQDEFGATLRPAKPIHRTTVNKWERGHMGQHSSSITLILKAFPDSPRPPLDGVSDPPGIPGVHVSTDETTGEYNVMTTEGQTVGRELDEIDDVPLRKRARNAALAAIESERAKPRPQVPDVDKSGSASRHR